METDDFKDKEDLDFIKSRKPLNVNVETLLVPELASEERNDATTCEKECYKLSKTGYLGGFALILNIMEFDNDNENKHRRYGSEKDVDYLTDLLIQLKFEVYLFPKNRKELYEKNRSKETMLNHIKAFKKECENKLPACIIVFVGSHGDLFNIWTSDFNPEVPGTYNTLLIRENIVDQFLDTKCPKLVGIPRIFLFQACQGFPESGEQPQAPEENSIQTTPLMATLEDILICTPTIPGELADRDYHKGSLFIYCFTYMMMRYSLKRKSFQNILEKIEDMLKQLQRGTDGRQVHPLGIYPKAFFDKELYFSGYITEPTIVKNFCQIPVGIGDFMAPSSKKQFCIVQTPDNTMTCNKIQEKILEEIQNKEREKVKSCRITEMENFVNIVSSKEPNDPNLLHIVKNCTKENIDHFFKHLKSFPRKRVHKVILVTSMDRDIYQNLEKEHKKNNIEVDFQMDPMSFGDFSPSYKRQIERKLAIIYKIDVDKIYDIKGVGLVDFIAGRSLFKETLPKKKDYYVIRALQSRNIISTSIFQKKLKDIFVMKGIKRNVLSELAKGRGTVSSSGYIEGCRDAQFIYQEHPDHFQDICDRTHGVSVHLLKYEDYILRWITSEGDMTLVQANVVKPKGEVYNVTRSIHLKIAISNSIFKQESLDIIVIRGIRKKVLYDLANGKKIISSTEYIEGSRNAQYIYLDSPHHFQYICETRDGVAVHLLEYQEHILRWNKSQGDITEIQANVAEPGQQDEIPEWDFCIKMNANSNKPIIICDRPGMGKSWLLQEIGRSLSRIYIDRTVIFIRLNEFMLQYQKYNKADKLEDVKKTLQKMIGKHPMEEVVLQSKLNADKISVELLLDGLDEVYLSYSSTALEILQKVQTSLKSTRLWVTSRPHLMQKLESKLNILAYNINPFSEGDQINFLTLFWSREVKLHQIKSVKLAKHCLNLLKNTIKSTEQDIAGIPLQCLLIAEVYEKYSQRYAKVSEEDFESPLPPKNIDVGSVLDLFEKLIKKKLSIYRRKRVYGVSKLSKKSAIKQHVQLSMQLIFGDEFQMLQPFYKSTKNKEVLKIGILDPRSDLDVPRFIHRTFADYFVAWFVVKNMAREPVVKRLQKLTSLNCGNKLLKFFVEHVLKTELYGSDDKNKFWCFSYGMPQFGFRHPNIAYFINAILLPPAQAQERIPNQATQNYKAVTADIPDSNAMQQLAHACGINNFTYLLKFFGATQMFEEYSSTIFNPKFIFFIVNNSSRTFLEYGFHQFDKHNSELTPHWQFEVLRSAVKRGNYNIFDFLINNKNLRNIVENQISDLRLLLHDCVRNTWKKIEHDINERIDMAKWLVGMNGKLLEEQDMGGYTPLLLRPHPLLIKTLIDLEANVHAKNKKKQTILHAENFTWIFSSDDYNRLVLSIPMSDLEQLVRQECDQGQTPLHSVVEQINLQSETLDIFKEAKADFRFKVDGFSVFGMAIKCNGNKETLQGLYDHGAYFSLDNYEDYSWEYKCWDGVGNFLHLAVHYDNIGAIDVLVNNCMLDVNHTNRAKKSALDVLIERRDSYRNRFEMGVALHELGGGVSTDPDQLLIEAAYDANVDSVRILLHIGAKANSHDDKESTADDDADYDDNDDNDKKSTPLHQVVTSIEYKDGKSVVKIAKLLLDKDADLRDVTNIEGKTALDILKEELKNMVELKGLEWEIGGTLSPDDISFHDDLNVLQMQLELDDLFFINIKTLLEILDLRTSSTMN